jgi:hypothetical protein
LINDSRYGNITKDERFKSKMGNRGSKSRISKNILVKEQRVDGFSI